VALNTSFRRAVANIAELGDTDVYPLPIENPVFFDRPADVVNLLESLHQDFESRLELTPPVNQSALTMIGYTSFRWATQVDPLWNAYLLGITIEVAPALERARRPRTERSVFSYRYHYDARTKRLFREDGWSDFNDECAKVAERFKWVVTTDIADFYPRVSHHRLENALRLGVPGSDIPGRIIAILGKFSRTASYGLPVGGPAARMLSELLLNRTDRLMRSKGIRFCRYADDYRLFCRTREDAYNALRYLTEILQVNEGLTLQRYKTRVLTAEDFLNSSALQLTPGPTTAPTDVEAKEREFLGLSLRFDPYSATARADYETLREQVERFDITGMLAREMNKSHIHTSLTKRLINALEFIDDEPRNGAALSLIDNLPTLTPIVPNVLRGISTIFDGLSDGTQTQITRHVRERITDGDPILNVDVNLGYALRLLGRLNEEESQMLCAQIFDGSKPFIQRDIVLLMARWQADYWLSDKKNYYGDMHPWVRRAFILASYILGDEGRHWRDHAKAGFTPLETLMRDWMASKVQTKGWELPL